MSGPEQAAEGPQLVITMTAIERLRELVDDSDEQGSRIRIEAERSGDELAFSMRVESEARSDDIELDFLRIGVLLSPYADRQLRHCEMDFRSDQEGEYFVVRSSS